MPISRRIPRAFTALVASVAFVGLAIVASPARADTESDLRRAKADLVRQQSEMRRITLLWNAAEAKLAETERAVDSAERDIARLQASSARATARLQERAILAFQVGRSSSLESLLSSGSLADFTDRIEFLGQIVQGDADLAILQATNAERIKQRQDDLIRLRDQREQNAEELGALERDLAQRIRDLQTRVNELATRFRQETTLLGLLGQSLRPGAPISRCPVGGSNSFVDSFGWPRSGGRTHEGIDLISPYGTPLVAVASGYAYAAPNYLGGNAVIVRSAGGDWTYYAHLSRYGTLGNVSAGTVIGYVGSTGNSGVPHLHFEYHPGGGAAINPYAALNIVC